MKLDQIKECVDYFKDKIGITLVVVTGILFLGLQQSVVMILHYLNKCL